MAKKAKPGTIAASDVVNRIGFLNTASPQDLIRLRYIGAVMAERIIQARPYKSLEDLVRAKLTPRASNEVMKAKLPAIATGARTSRSVVAPPKSPPLKARPKGFALVAPETAAAATVTDFDQSFQSILQERGDDRFEGRVPPLAVLGIYYGPPANKTDVFVIWVVETPLEEVGTFSRFGADFRQIISTKHEDGVDLKPNQHFIETYVDNETISRLLRDGRLDNHNPDAQAASELLLAAVKTRRFVKLMPETANANATAVAALIDALAAKG